MNCFRTVSHWIVTSFGLGESARPVSDTTPFCLVKSSLWANTKFSGVGAAMDTVAQSCWHDSVIWGCRKARPLMPPILGLRSESDGALCPSDRSSPSHSASFSRVALPRSCCCWRYERHVGRIRYWPVGAKLFVDWLVADSWRMVHGWWFI